MKRKSMSMGRNGPLLHVVCALAIMGKSDVPLSHAHRCHVDTRSWHSSLKEAAAQFVWALGNPVPMKAVCFRMGRTGS